MSCWFTRATVGGVAPDRTSIKVKALRVRPQDGGKGRRRGRHAASEEFSAVSGNGLLQARVDPRRLQIQADEDQLDFPIAKLLIPALLACDGLNGLAG